MSEYGLRASLSEIDPYLRRDNHSHWYPSEVLSDWLLFDISIVNPKAADAVRVNPDHEDGFAVPADLTWNAFTRNFVFSLVDKNIVLVDVESEKLVINNGWRYYRRSSETFNGVIPYLFTEENLRMAIKECIANVL